MPKVTLEMFWYWVNERESIFQKREQGVPREDWTSDPVLKRFRFTNVFRENDRGTRICWNYLSKCPEPRDIVANIVIYRIFNKPETAEAIKMPLLNLDFDSAYQVVPHLKTPFTSAHLQQYGNGNWSEVLGVLYKDSEKMGEQILKNGTVEYANKIFLKKIPFTGKFFAHQFAQDCRYNLIPNAPDGATFTIPGPGALRCLEWMGCGRSVESLYKVWESQDSFRAEHVKKLEMKDIQQSLCEVQKYAKLEQYLETGKRCKIRNFP